MKQTPFPCFRILAVAAAALLAACGDDGIQPDPKSPPARIRADLRTGFITGRDGQPLQVTYQVLSGRAIFEGDIDLGPADQVPATREALERLRRTPVAAGLRANSVITGSQFWWRNASGYGGTLPYVIDPAHPNPQWIHDAMNEINLQVPSIKFVARTTEADYVRFVPGTGACYSAVGRQGGQQFIQLAQGCVQKFIMHEILHTLGFWHEHNRCDRDTYVEILWANIHPDDHWLFKKNCGTSTTDSNAGTDYHAYDEHSIMHYGDQAFSMNQQPTMVSKRGVTDLGFAPGLSATDVATLRTIYPSSARRRSCCTF